jgi:hypothetical protein
MLLQLELSATTAAPVSISDGKTKNAVAEYWNRDLALTPGRK